MNLFRWLRSTPTAPKPTPSFRPGFEPLGDRIMPHAGSFFGISAFSSPWHLRGALHSGADNATPVSDTVTASQFTVLARSTVFAGSQMRVTIIAVGETGRPDRDYTGTVSLTSSDSAAVLPESYTFTAEDRGRHTFRVTLNTTGDQTVTATDEAGLTGTQTVNVKVAPVATSLFVQAERNPYTGAVTRVLVAALDESNRPVSSYTGTVSLTSTDTGATLPDAYTFTSSDRGVHVFQITPSVAGEQTVTATDGAGLTGTATLNVTDAPAATRIAVVARPRVGNETSVQFYLVALDANNRIVPTYTGTVTTTSSDTGATLPEPYTFTAADRGVKALSMTFATTGQQTISVTDEAGLTGSTRVNVVARGNEFGDFFGGRGGRFQRPPAGLIMGPAEM